MPARRAMSSVDVPSRPRPANSIIAASSTSSRRSAAVSLVVVVISMPARLVTTHKLVKRLRHTIEVAVRQPIVERKGESPLEHPVGVGEWALVAVGAEAVEGVRPDLALDPL